MTDRTYRLVIRAALGLFALLGLRIEVRGAQHLPRHGGAVLASNHTGFLDFLFVGLVGRRRGRFVRFLAKEAVFDAPVAGAAMRAMRHVPVDRGHGEIALRHAVAAARAGEVVGVFPEATISRSWELRPFRPGAAAVATWCQVPLVPVVVWGAQRVWTVDGRWSLRRGVAISVVVGEPLHPLSDADPYAVSDELRDRMAALLVEAVDAYPDRPRDDTDRWWVPASRGGTAPGIAEGLHLDEEGMRRADAAAAAARTLRASQRHTRGARRQSSPTAAQ
ncbi:lysophospholipid acyltransferase family protein [Terrabacter sp. NPDC080008]|uniref:lysophospholipid acyltransferase family protein n=1 Tax=Terrabacter sp. NPDC080008 TaxID=3155176 RepID=UPI00344E78A9